MKLQKYEINSIIILNTTTPTVGHNHTSQFVIETSRCPSLPERFIISCQTEQNYVFLLE